MHNVARAAVAIVAFGLGCSEGGGPVSKRPWIGADGLPASTDTAGGSPNGSGGAAGTPNQTSGTTAAGGGAGSSLPNATTGSEDCGSVELEPLVEFQPGNLLVLFDRSMSMATPFGASDRLQEAGNALLTALAPFVCQPTGPDEPACRETLSVAALMFPSYDQQAFPNGLDVLQLSCTVHDMSSPEQIPWQSATSFVSAWDPYWASRTLVSNTLLGGPQSGEPLLYGTPIPVAFQRGAEALQDPNIVGNKAVLFLTDGEEVGNCAGVNGVTQAGRWFAEDIPTYVVSLAAAAGPGAAFNDAVANAGGTGNAIYPTDAASLTANLSDIVQNAAGKPSCRVPLNGGRIQEFDQACERGDVFVDSIKVPCDQENQAEGFYVVDEATIEIVGQYCTRLERKGDLRASFPCTFVLE